MELDALVAKGLQQRLVNFAPVDGKIGQLLAQPESVRSAQDSSRPVVSRRRYLRSRRPRAMRRSTGRPTAASARVPLGGIAMPVLRRDLGGVLDNGEVVNAGLAGVRPPMPFRRRQRQ